MKKLLFALTITLGLLAPLAPRAQAATDVSLNFFYDNLSSEGSWVEVGDYGYCFQPTVAFNNPDWRPYADGYWAYTDVGWTWVSYEDFGWATYHYGRWSNLADYGWVWVPGYEWGPAWVSWRTGGDYIGWAPLPATAGAVYEGRAINAQVDVEYDIGPEYYNFVDIRYIGEPVLRGRIVQPSQNVTIINRTVNVTNITYNNSTVYNYGPSYERVNQYSTRPIERLTLTRETTVANLSLQAGGGRNLNRVNGNQLMVVAPAIQKSQQRIAPKTVKTKIEKPTFERGWKGISNRQQIQAEMKKENAQKVPPPSFQPQKGRKAAAAPAAAETEQANPNQPNEANRAARQERQQARKASAAEANAPEATPNAETPKADQAQREAQRAKRQSQRQEKAAQSDANDNSAQPNETKQNEGDRAARRAARQNRQNASDTSNNAPKAETADQRNQQNAASSDADRNAARERMKDRREKRAQAADQVPNNSNKPEANRADQPKADRPQADQERNPQLDQRREARQERRAARRANAEPKPADQPEQAQPEPRRAEPHSRSNQPEAAPQGNRAERNAPQNRPAARAQTPAQEKPTENADDNTPRKPKKKAPNDENKPDQP